MVLLFFAPHLSRKLTADAVNLTGQPNDKIDEYSSNPDKHWVLPLVKAWHIRCDRCREALYEAELF